MHSPNVGNLKRICSSCICRSTPAVHNFFLVIGLLLGVCCFLRTAVAAVIADNAASSLTAVVGDSVNLSCVTTSVHPVDIYHEDRPGASPLPLYANRIVLEPRYDVLVSSTRECRRVADRGRRHATAPDEFTAITVGADDGVCWHYVLVIVNVQLNDSGLYLCTEHGEPTHNALRTVRLAVVTGYVDNISSVASSSTNEESETSDRSSSGMFGFVIVGLISAGATVTLAVTGVIYCLYRRRRSPPHDRQGGGIPVECTDRLVYQDGTS